MPEERSYSNARDRVWHQHVATIQAGGNWLGVLLCTSGLGGVTPTFVYRCYAIGEFDSGLV